VAASTGHGKLYSGRLLGIPGGRVVPADSPVKKPEDLAGLPISVGYQSGSHYATIQALEQFMPADQINLSFNDGMLFKRLELLVDKKVPAATLFSGPYYFAEQLGFRKIIDATFMITTMITGNPDPEDVRKFFRALKRAQRDIDLRPDRYTHYYKKEFRPLSRHEWTRAAGVRANASCSSPTPRKCSTRPSSGSPTTAFLPTAAWAPKVYESSIATSAG
jgi:hypothetical protein